MARRRKIAAFSAVSTIVVLVCGLLWSGDPIDHGSPPNPSIPIPPALTSLTPTGVPTPSEKKQVFTRIWTLFNTYYPNFQMKGVDWAQERSKYQPEALAASTWPQFFAVVNQMIVDLHDAHCALIGEPLPTIYSPLLLTAWSNDHVLVTWSGDPQQVPVGSVITAVNGIPMSIHMLHTPFSLGQGLNDPDGRVALTSYSDLPEHLSLWIPAKHLTRKVAISVYPAPDPNLDRLLSTSQIEQVQSLQQTAWYSHPGMTYGTPITNGNSAFRVAHLQSGILYVYIPAMTPPSNNQTNSALLAEFQQVLHLALQSKGLIIDIRGNEGGGMWPGLWFARHLYDGITAPIETRFPLSLAKKISPQFTGFSQTIPLKVVQSPIASHHFTNWGIMQISPLTPHLKIPSALLTDGWDASAAENFTVFMNASPEVATFGSTTTGADGSPHDYPVMKGVIVGISSWQERVMATGLPIEGIGIRPDHPVYVSDATLLNEIVRSQENDPSQTMAHDPVLQAAKKWIQGKITASTQDKGRN